MSRVDRACAAALAVLLLVPACTRRLYEGPQLAFDQVAVIHVGNTMVREIDGERRRGGGFDVGKFEVAPGAHRLVLVFELPERTLGIRTIPAQSGEGTCVLEFSAAAGKQYDLGSQPRGDSNTPRWDGAWEAWVRDQAASSAADVVGRCTSQAAPETTAAPFSPPPVPVAAAADAAAVPLPLGMAAPPLGVAPPPPVSRATPVATVPLPPASPRAAPAAATIRLGEWNLRSLGRAEHKDIARIAAAIDANFDILAVTEVLQISGAHSGYDALLSALGGSWAGQITDTPRPNTAADGVEYYAVLYRRDRVRACAGWKGLRYTPDNDGSGRDRGPDRFLREPAFGCFEAGDPVQPGVDFLLAVYRAPAADGDAADVAAEVSRLDDVYTAMKLARPGEDDLIIAGDFHLESVELPRRIHATDRTSGGGSVLNLLGERTASLPDHILVYDPGATAELLGDAEALDIRGIAPSNDAFYRTVSDHLPIMVRLRVSGPDDD